MSKNHPTPAEREANLKNGDHVALVKRRCPVLGTDHDAEILLHTRFGNVKEHHGKVVGWMDRPCDDAIKQYNLGPDTNVALCGMVRYEDKTEAVTALAVIKQEAFANFVHGNTKYVEMAKKHLFIFMDAKELAAILPKEDMDNREPDPLPDNAPEPSTGDSSPKEIPEAADPLPDNAPEPSTGDSSPN